MIKDMNNPLVSVIVPIYGVERYISRCAYSLMEQTYSNVEYIFVNDCTKKGKLTVAKVFLGKGMDFMNSSGKVIIGDNVSFGQNVMVLKGVTIGNDCFIGAGSIVTKDIPSGSVAVGAPCKVLMTIDEYFRKRLDRCESEAFEYVRSIKERYGRLPRVDEMKEEFIFFVSGSEIDNYPMIPIKEQLGPMYENYRQHHIAKYGSFEEFLTAAGVI